MGIAVLIGLMITLIPLAAKRKEFRRKDLFLLGLIAFLQVSFITWYLITMSRPEPFH